MDRRKPQFASGVLAALLISPRYFHYTVCAVCERSLFYTYVGELCPFCNTEVTEGHSGQLPTVSCSVDQCRNGMGEGLNGRR